MYPLRSSLKVILVRTDTKLFLAFQLVKVGSILLDSGVHAISMDIRLKLGNNTGDSI